MRIVRSAKSTAFRWGIVVAGLAPLLMGADCDSNGDDLGGVSSIIAGVFELVLGILQLVD